MEGVHDAKVLIALQWSHTISGMETKAGGWIIGTTLPLQWSHTISGMETIVASVTPSTNALVLQWSHTISGMETRPMRPDSNSRMHASMEPYHFRYGNKQM